MYIVGYFITKTKLCKKYAVRVTLDKDEKTLTVSDNGIGMSAEEIENIKQAQAITDAAFTHICGFITPERTELEVAAELGAREDDIPALVAKLGLGDGRLGSFMPLSGDDVANIFRLCCR